MIKYRQEIKYLDNYEEIANEFINSVGLCKYPSEIEVDCVDIKLKKGDTVELIDKNLGINATYRVIKIKSTNELENVKLKFIKITK